MHEYLGLFKIEKSANKTGRFKIIKNARMHEYLGLFKTEKFPNKTAKILDN